MNNPLITFAVMVVTTIIQILGYIYILSDGRKRSKEDRCQSQCINNNKQQRKEFIQSCGLILFSCVFSGCYFVFEKVFGIRFENDNRPSKNVTDEEVLVLLKYEFFVILISFFLFVMSVFLEWYENDWFFSFAFIFYFVVFLCHLLLNCLYYFSTKKKIKISDVDVADIIINHEPSGTELQHLQ